MTEDNIIDYITAESSLERHASGIAALSEDQRDPWNDKYARKLVADFRRRAETNRHNSYGRRSMRPMIGYSTFSLRMGCSLLNTES